MKKPHQKNKENPKKSPQSRQKASSSTASVKQETYTIPKIIHFIWAGGLMAMKPQGIDVVNQWAKKYPSFEIYLWVDKQTASIDLRDPLIIELKT